MLDARRVIEAALFSAGRPLKLREICDLTGLSATGARKNLRALAKEYAQSALEIAKVGEKYTLQVKQTYTHKVSTLAKKEIPDRLLRTLTLIASRQPIRQAELCKLVGTRIYQHVKQLANLGMIKGKPEGRTKILTTTHLFPEYFGISTTSRKRIKELLAQEKHV